MGKLGEIAAPLPLSPQTTLTKQTDSHSEQPKLTYFSEIVALDGLLTFIHGLIIITLRGSSFDDENTPSQSRIQLLAPAWDWPNHILANPRVPVTIL